MLRSNNPALLRRCVCVQHTHCRVVRTSAAFGLRQRRLCCAAQQGGERPSIQGQRTIQIENSEMLAKLLEADDVREVARQNAGALTEGFFMVGSTYLQMAKKEGNADVVGRIESALRIAMEERNKTLRPEIQLLNKLLAEEESKERKRILNRTEIGEVLVMNDRYFFSLLDRMRSDVEAQPDNPGKAELVEKLDAIKQEAATRLPADTPRSKGFG